MEKEKYYLIDGKLAETILNYLAKRPYIEVSTMIDGLYSIRPVNLEPINQPTENTSSLQSDICQTTK